MFEQKRKFLAEKYSEKQGFYNAMFFIFGVIFDILTLGEIDKLSSIIQQLCYITAIGIFLYFDLIHFYTPFNVSKKLEKIWNYREPILHFMLGALLSIYSIFFIKSASIFSSFGFIAFMLILLIGNELKVVQKQKVSLKISMYFICIFSFFSMIYPVILGHVGRIPFTLSILSTLLCIWAFYRLVFRRIENKNSLRKALLLPSTAILLVFLGFYYLGWIPPVPLSVKEIGIYHHIEKTKKNEYKLFYERPEWKFWLSGDQNFKAYSGDKAYIFTRVFSPARFDDTLYLNWQLYSKRYGWTSTDKISMRVYGGRKSGYRGYSFKENLKDGDWRVLVETSDGREVGRLNFNIKKIDKTRINEFPNFFIR